MLRATEAFSLIETRLAGLVHRSVEDSAERPAHERFIISRLVAGSMSLAALPAFLLWRGTPSGLDAVAALCAAGSAIAGLVVSRTGNFAAGAAVTSVSLAGLVVCLALSSDAFGLPVLALLAAVPLQAALSGSRRIVAQGVACALAAGLAAMAIHAALPAGRAAIWEPGAALLIVGFVALFHLAGDVFARFGGGAAGSRSRVAEAHETSLLQAIDDLVTWHDANGAIVRASSAAGRLLGVPGFALSGQGLLGHVHVSDRPLFLKAVSDAARADQPVVAQFRLHRHHSAGPGREVIWVEMRAHRTRGQGEPAVVAVTRDISAHYRHAEELEVACAAAERADGAKGRFLATVSHELRTPLNAIIGFSEVMAGRLAETMPPEQHREYAGIIHDSGHHLLAVVNTLLDMSKIEAGEFDFAPEPFDIAALTQGCCDLMQLKADGAGIVMERRMADNLPEIVGDRRAYRQIVINLLSNALKFTPVGGRVAVCVRREIDRVVLSVSDTGIGIPDGHLSRIGEAFFQSDSSYDRRHEGTGLGLSVVRGLLGLHRGTLSIESAPGAGTDVTVTLPFDCRVGVPARQPVTVRATARPARIAAPALRRRA